MKAILKKMDLIVNLKGFALVLLGVGMLVSSQGAWGQDTSGPSSKIMESLIPRRSNSTDKLTSLLDAPITLPGGAPAPAAESNENKGAEEARQADNAGRNDQTTKTVVLPALKGFRQLADAEPIQKMYKELINTKVPVLVQTMMMVENGAATGFIGSMNMVSNLMNNTIQTQQFQLELMNLTDYTGQLKYAYAGKIQKAFEAKTVTSWPAALYVANGDSAEVKTDGSTMGKIIEIPESEPFKITDNPNTQPKTAPTPGGSGTTDQSFVRDILMSKETTNSTKDPKYKNQDIDKLQKEFIELVGDFKITHGVAAGGAKNDVVREFNTIHIKAKEGDNEQAGLSLKARDETQKVWENLNDLMYQLCKFKKDNKNNDLEPIKKITASTSAGWTPEMWENASAPDIVITQNLLEQIFVISRPSGELSEIDCSVSYPQGGGLGVPFGGEFAEIQDGDPDICQKGDTSVSPCLRFRALYHMATIIGNSRAYHTYEILKNITARYAKDPSTQQLHYQLFAEVFPEGEIEIYIDKNRDRWAELILYMARYMQGQQGSGGTFKPGGSNAVGISPGADTRSK